MLRSELFAEKLSRQIWLQELPGALRSTFQTEKFRKKMHCVGSVLGTSLVSSFEVLQQQCYYVLLRYCIGVVYEGKKYGT